MTPEVLVLKEETCPSLSGKSTLTYNIGCTAESEIVFRVYANTGNGYFSQDWVPLGSILEAIDKCKDSFTWYVLYPLFKGKSVNTACFIMATLKAEGLVEPLRRRYALVDPGTFLAKIKELMATELKDASPLAKKKVRPGKGRAKKGDPSLL